MGKFYKNYVKTNEKNSTQYKADKAYKMVKFLKKNIDGEVKFVDVSHTATVTHAAPWIFALNPIERGTVEDGRVGNSVMARSINVRFNVTRDTTVHVYNDFIRVLVLMDKNSISGTNPGINDILEDSTAQLCISSGINLDNKRRFKVLVDKVIRLDPYKHGDNGKKYITFEKRVKLSYDGEAITDYHQNTIFFVAMTARDNNPPTMYLFSRLAYVDN